MPRGNRPRPINETVDDEAQPQGTNWDDFTDQLYSDDRIAEIQNPDGTITYAAIYVGPEWYERFGTPTSPKPGVAYGTMPVPEPIPPTQEELDGMAMALDNVFSELEQSAPYTANLLKNNPRLLMAIPELTAIVGPYLENYGPLTQTIEWLMSDLNVVDYDHWSKAAELAPATTQFFHDYGKLFNDQELDIIATLYTGLSPEGQDRVSALSWRWLNPDENESRDLLNEQTKVEFLEYIYGESARQKSHEDANRGNLGAVGNFLDWSRRTLWGGVSDAWAWVTSIGDPTEQIYRSGLTLGQNIALTSGFDPSDTGWSWASGTVDFLTATVGDPINVAFGFGVASKLAKTVAVSADASRLGRATAAAKSLIPVVGRKATDLPRFSRAPSVRFFHTLFGKTADDLVERAFRKGVFNDIHDLMKAKGFAAVVERYPELERLAGGAAELLESATSGEHMRDIFLEIRHGNFLGEESSGYVEIVAQLNDVRTRQARLANEAMESGDLHIDDVIDGMDPVRLDEGIWVGTEGSSRILSRSTQANDNTRKLVFRSKLRRARVDDGFINNFLGWTAGIYARRVARVPGLGENASKAINRIARGLEQVGDWTDEGIETTSQFLESFFRTAANTKGDDLGMIAIGDRLYQLERQAGDEGVTYLVRELGSGEPVAGVRGARTTASIEDGGSLWTAESLREQGAMKAIIDRIMDEDGVEAAATLVHSLSNDVAITPGGARAISSMAKRLVAKTGGGEASMVDDLLDNVLNGRYDLLTTRQRQVLSEFLDAHGYDILEDGDIAFLSTRGADKTQSIIDATGQSAALRATRDLDREVMRLESLANNIKAADRRTWAIADIPPKVRPEWKLGLKPWRKHATNNVNSWWGNFRRTAGARLFGQRAPKSVNLNNAYLGGKELRHFLQQLGVSRDFITDALNQFYRAKPSERYDLVGQVIIRAAGEVDHPILRYGLEQIVSKTGVFSFGVGPDLAEVMVGASRTRAGARSALPYMVSQMSESFELPGEAFFKMLGRYRQAKSFKAVGVGGHSRGLVAGLTKGTIKRRQQIAARYENLLKSRGVDAAAMGLGPDDFLAMAYSNVMGDASGIGKLQTLLSATAKPFRGFHNFFTRLQLAGRPITWPLRVVFLEEGIRAQFFDLPSMYRNPIRFMGGLYDTSVTTRVTKHRKDLAAGIRAVVETLAPVRPGRAFRPQDFDALKQSIPEFAQWVGNRQASSYAQLRGLLASFLESGSDHLHRLGQVERAGYSVAKATRKAAKKVDTAETVLRRLNLPVDFDWADIDQIANKGFIALIQDQLGSGTHILEYEAGRMTSDQLRHYGNAYGGAVISHLDDPIMRKYGLGRIVARADAATAETLEGVTAADLLNEPTWAKFRDIVKQAADENGWLEGRQLRGTLRPGDMRRATAEEFHEAISEASDVVKNGRRVGETVYVYDVDEYRDMKLFLSPDGKTGAAVKSDGDIVSVFNVGAGGNADGAMARAIDEGGVKLDAFDEEGFLPDLYKRFGFEETRREPWDPQYAPQGWKGGEPDVVYMNLRPGDPDDLALAQAYLDNVVDPMTEHLLRPLLGDDPVTAGAIADELRRTRSAVLSDGTSINLTATNHGAVRTTIREYVERNEGLISFPARVAGNMNAKFLFDDDAKKYTKLWQRITGNILEVSGEKTTQLWNRRPAWLSTYNDEYRYLTNVLGMPDDIARTMAADKATEIVNHVFYNLDNATPFLRSMNRSIPFFGAMWEVAQTWAYKIPMAGGTPMGLPMMIRKVDRVLEGLNNIGILRYEDRYDEEGNVKDSTMYLVFGDPPEGEVDVYRTPLGELVSKAGDTMLEGPRTLVKLFAKILNSDYDFDAEGAFKDQTMFQIGSPLTPTGETAHGIMAVNQMYLGMDPAKSLVARSILTKLGIIGDTKLADAEAGQSLADLAAQTDSEIGEFIRTNSVLLRDKLGNADYARLLRGTLAPENVTLNDGEYYEIPGSSMMETMIEETIFPFGVEDSVAGSLYDITPSWLPYALRGFGLWQSSGDPTQWANLDADGRVELPDELPLLEVLNPPTGRMQIVSEINKQLLHLEAAEGLITRWKEEVAKLENLEQGDESWADQKQLVTELNAKILKRAIDNAGASIFTRGIIGMVSPGNPRLMFEEEQIVEDYWDARDMAAGEIRGSANYKLPPNIQRWAARQELVARFMEDESGDSAKEWFKRTYPEIFVFTQGKTYWEPGGEPPEMESIDAYFEAVQAGLRQPLPPTVLMQKLARSSISTAQEVQIRNEFGTDPEEAALAIINDWQAYRDILNESKIEYAALEYWDELHDDSNYRRWKERNLEDQITATEELARRYDRIIESVDILEELAPSQDMQPDERRQYIANLRNAAQGYRDFIGDFNDTVRNTFQDSPREMALNWYFDTVTAPYYEKLADMYERVDAARDSEEQSRIYEEIRQFQTQEFQRRYYTESGTEFPNALLFSWNKKTPEEQQERMLRWMGLKPEWLSLEATTRLTQQSPQLTKYLPSAPEDFVVYSELNQKLNDIADAVEADPDTGIRLLTESQARKARERLREEFRAYMIANNRQSELDFLDMYPIERLSLAGLLPEVLQPYASYARQLREELARIDKGPGSIPGGKLVDRLWVALHQDPNYELVADAMEELGAVMFDKHTLDSVFAALIYGETFGEY